MPRFRASTRLVIIRGELVPVFWPMTKIASAWSKSSRTTVPLPTPDRRRQAAAGRFVAHVGAIREIVGAELAHEDRIQERGFVGGAPGGVELRLVRAVQRAQALADQRERLVPAARHVVVAGRVVAHRLGETALHFQPVIRLLHEFGHRMLGEELAGDAELRRLVRQRLGAVLAEIEFPAAGLVRVGAARALLKPPGLFITSRASEPFTITLCSSRTLAVAAAAPQPPAGAL